MNCSLVKVRAIQSKSEAHMYRFSPLLVHLKINTELLFIKIHIKVKVPVSAYSLVVLSYLTMQLNTVLFL